MADKNTKAMRDAYGEALAKLGEENQDIVVLDADLAGATKTAVFAKKYPKRHIDCGIAECNMMGIAAGMAVMGRIPFASTFAMFAAGRAFEQVRNSIAYPELNVKIAATHAGITVGEDGATHQCNEDIALMRAIPGMMVIVPSDNREAEAAVYAAAAYKGPVYLRFSRCAVPDIHVNPDYRFEPGKAITMKEGTDAAVFAAGICVSEALEAAKALEAEGIHARVINVHTIKPLDEETVIRAAKETGFLVTVEEHSVIGGLGAAVAQCVSRQHPARVISIGIPDVFGESGKAEELVKKFGLDADGIYKIIKNEMQNR